MMLNYICIFLLSHFLPGFSNNINSGTKNPAIQTETMSSSILKIISTNPSYIPDKNQMEGMKRFLSKMYKSEKTEYIITETIEFIDPGENFERVSCNLCGREINMETWQNEMDKAQVKQFTDLIFTTPCCHKKTSLNNLTYTSPAGFAKFVISISDPHTGLSEVELKQLQDISGTILRIIRAHY
jgi:hypothetical protein